MTQLAGASAGQSSTIGGVVVNFGPLAGTGAGIVLQDMNELEISR